MANLLRIEPGMFHPDKEAWFVYDDGRRYLRSIEPQEEAWRGPMLISDSIGPVVSQADGKTYDSKSALYRSYTPGGNPQGQRYEVIGEQQAKPFVKERSSREGRAKAIMQAREQLGY